MYFDVTYYYCYYYYYYYYYQYYCYYYYNTKLNFFTGCALEKVETIDPKKIDHFYFAC